MDKFEQALDFIKEASQNVGLHFNIDFAVLLDIGADALYDEVQQLSKIHQQFSIFFFFLYTRKKESMN